MYPQSVIGSLSLAMLLAGPSALALFDCNADQHAYPPTDGKFVVHYTAQRDSSFEDDAWIRICKPNASGDFDNIKALATGCGNDHPATFSADTTTLNGDFTVTNGNGCDSTTFGNLDGAAFDYNGQHRDLGADPDPNCGPRDHGISCQFTL